MAIRPSSEGLTLNLGTVTIAAAAANAITFAAQGFSPADRAPFSRMSAELSLAAPASTSGDTLDVFIDCSGDGGTTWINIIHFAQLLGNGGAKSFVAHTPPQTGGIDTTSADVAAAGAPRMLFGNQIRVRTTTVNGSGVCSFPLSVVLNFLP